MSEVYVNGKFQGYVENHDEFVRQVRTERRKGVVDANVNLFYNEQSDEIHVYTTRGRSRRPLIVVKDGVPLRT